MAIVINGSGTVTGLAVGGLPDGTVDADTVAADVATQAELDAAGVGGATGVDFNDNVKARFGTGNDLEIYHDATNSLLVNNTGGLRLCGDTVYLRNGANSENGLIFTADGSVDLYHNNVKRIETTSTGINLHPDTHRKFTSRIYNSGTDDANVWTSYHGSNGNIREVGLEGSLIRFYTGADSGTSTTKKLEITSDGRGKSQFTAMAWANVGLDNVAAGNSSPGGSLNVSSVTLNSTGNAKFNFTNSIASTNVATLVNNNTAGGTAIVNHTYVDGANVTTYHSNGNATNASLCNFTTHGGS